MKPPSFPLASLVLLGVLLLAACGGEEDRYQALIGRLLSDDYAAAVDARAELVRAGAAALPALEQALREGTPDAKVAVMEVIGRIPEETARRVATIRALLADENEMIRGAASDVLSRMGAPGRAALAAALGDENENAAKTAAVTLMYMKEGAAPWIDDIVRALEDKRVRLYALRTLRDMGAKASKAIPDVARLLAGDDTDVHHDAANALAEMGPEVASVADTLYARMNNSKRNLRIFVAKAIAQIGTDAVPRLRKALTGTDEHTQETAARALRHLGAAGAAALPELIDRVSNGSAAVKEAAAEALGAMGAAARDALPALEATVKWAKKEGVLSLDVTASIAVGLIRKAVKAKRNR